MKLIKSDYSIIEQSPGLSGIYEQIELAGRTCYKSSPKYRWYSEDKKRWINEDSEEWKAIENLKKEYPTRGENISAKPFVARMIKLGHWAMLEQGTVYLAIPMTTYAPEAVNSYMDTPYAKVNQCNEFIFTDRYGDKVSAWCVTTNYRFLIEHDILEDLEFICEPTKYHEKRITVHFTTQIAISREFNRHKLLCVA